MRNPSRLVGDAGYGRPEGEGQAEDSLGCNPEDLMEQPIVLVGGAACLVFMAIFAVLSIGAVPPLTYGVRYNTFTKAADSASIYSCGRYFIGPWNTFLLFPASVQNIEFTDDPRLLASGVRYEPLHTRTREGLALHLQVSLQYELKQKEVGLLYTEFNLNYEQTFISTIRDVLIKAAAEYEAGQLWEERAKVGQTMQISVNEALSKTYAKLWGLQLMVIGLPTLYEESIVRTQVQKQATATRQNEQQAIQIRAQTSVIAAEYDRQVKIIMAHGRANFTFATKQAEAMARQRTLDTEAHILDIVSKNLTLDAAKLVIYQKYGAYQMMQKGEFFYGFEDADNMNVMVSAGVDSVTAAPSPSQHSGIIDSATAAPSPPQHRMLMAPADFSSASDLQPQPFGVGEL